MTNDILGPKNDWLDDLTVLSIYALGSECSKFQLALATTIVSTASIMALSTGDTYWQINSNSVETVNKYKPLTIVVTAVDFVGS